MTLDETQSKRFFVAESLHTARQLPLCDAQKYLKGLLLLAGERDELDPLRRAYEQIFELNSQMEELQSCLDLK